MLDDVREEQAEYEAHISGEGGHSSSGGSEEGLSSKIDSILKEAKLDVSLVNGLTKSIKNLEASAEALRHNIVHKQKKPRFSQGGYLF